MKIGKYEVHKYKTQHGEVWLPRRHLSYSSINLWRKSPASYRKRYYENEKPFETKHTIYGREIHKQIEEGKLVLDGCKPSKAYKFEKELRVPIGGVPILAYIDAFQRYLNQVTDFKTGTRKPDGSDRWTQVDVQKLDQLPFYAFLVNEKYKRVNDTARVYWLVTEEREVEEETVTFDGMELPRTGEPKKELVLTGEYKKFVRTLEPWELLRQKEIIIKSIHDINHDYRQYLREHA